MKTELLNIDKIFLNVAGIMEEDILGNILEEN